MTVPEQTTPTATSKIPCNRMLHISEKDLVVLTIGVKFVVFNCSTGSFIAAPTSMISQFSKPDNTPIQSIPDEDFPKAAISSMKYCAKTNKMALVADDKLCMLWDCENWSRAGCWTCVKRASSLDITKDGEAIVIADKFGDGYRFNVNDANDKGTLLSGHVSMILDMTLNPDNTLLLTSDRDEKLRVSQFPKMYNIENFCLNHREYVSFIKILPNEMKDSMCMTFGGDPHFSLFDYTTGKCLGKYVFADLLKAYEEQNGATNLQLPAPVAVNSAQFISSDAETVEFLVTIEKFPAMLQMRLSELSSSSPQVSIISIMNLNDSSDSKTQWLPHNIATSSGLALSRVYVSMIQWNNETNALADTKIILVERSENGTLTIVDNENTAVSAMNTQYFVESTTDNKMDLFPMHKLSKKYVATTRQPFNKRKRKDEEEVAEEAAPEEDEGMDKEILEQEAILKRELEGLANKKVKV